MIVDVISSVPKHVKIFSAGCKGLQRIAKGEARKRKEFYADQRCTDICTRWRYLRETAGR
jgi:hypothetical protein